MNGPIDITTPAAFEQSCAEVDSQLGGLDAPVSPLPDDAEVAQREEREACAKVCEAMKTRAPFDVDDVERGYNAALRRAAEAIRLRSNAAMT